MSTPKYAGWIPRREGQPWDALDDANLLDDRDHGCDVFTMARRARRTESEVEQRLKELEAKHPRRPGRAPSR